MKPVTWAALAAAAALAACAPAPEKSIEKDCVRLEMMKEIGGGADAKKSCACFAAKLKDDMSEKNLKALAKSLKDSKSESDFESNAKKNGLDESNAMVMMGAAKSCAMPS